jgi:TRAP-type mannitol/chloroaromatic compound transport system permease large subunit
LSDPILGLSMLGLIVAAIMMGFPTAFTMMGLGMVFGFVAFFDPQKHWYANQIFDLMVQRTYGTMNNDTLLSIPLFVFMGYVIERAALVDKMFHSVQLAFRRVPASLAVTTLLVCAFWGIASGIVGAVVVLMGVIAMRPMLSAGYDVRLASGVITAGGTLGILIPPSVMLIVYAAVAGQSIVKLYAGAMLPGFFLTLLYLVYIVGWALLDPKVAPKLPEGKYRLAVPDWIAKLERGPAKQVFIPLLMAAILPGSVHGNTADGRKATYGLVIKNLLAALGPILLTLVLFAAAWWYVIVHNAPTTELDPRDQTQIEAGDPPGSDDTEIEELGDAEQGVGGGRATNQSSQEFTSPRAPQTSGPSDSALGATPEGFYAWYGGFALVSSFLLFLYYWRMDGEQLEILKLLGESVVPLAVLTFIVLAVILFGITTATESAGIGALGALYLASFQKYRRWTLRMSVLGAAIGLALGTMRAEWVTMIVSGFLGAVMLGTAVPVGWDLVTKKQLLNNLKESTFLTAKTTAMVCWLFVGSALFSAVFALHGGQGVIERWVLGLDLTPLYFMILAQLIIFLLGWPLEWTEIIVIFVPIFVPLLAHFEVDPILFGIMVAVNLQAAFLSPPVAMSAFYLKGVSPKHVTLNQIFAGMMPYMLIVVLCLVFMYVWPGMTLWLPGFLYGR